MSEPIEQEVLAALAELRLEHEIIPCDPALADTAAFCRHYGIAPEESANTILVGSRTEPRQFAACVLLATTKLDVNHRVRKMMGVRRASFADAETTERLSGMKVGGVTPFGLPPELPVWIDRRVLQASSVVLGGGGRTMKIRMSPKGLTAIPNALVVDALAKPD